MYTARVSSLAGTGPRLVLLEPRLQRYAWGDPEFFPALFGSAGDGGPWAEAWYGAHPVGPADAGGVPLDQLIARDRRHWLGEGRPELPYLLKLLAAAQPLSIQVHPNASQASRGFAAEEAAGVARDAPHRRYRDPNPKPELLVALTPFHALCGFRPPTQDLLHRCPELAALLPSPQAGLRAILEAWFGHPDPGPALSSMLARLEREGPFAEDQPEHWALEAHRALGGGAPDRGLLFVFLLEWIRLEPGEALFLSAGVPHAYLRGAGVEIMASSDNVLRAGLTPKHVDPGALLETLRFDARRPPVLRPVKTEAGSMYPQPARAFDLTRMESGSVRTATGPETVLVTRGSATVSAGDQRVEIGPGQAVLVAPKTVYELDLKGEAFMATVPDSPAPPRFRGRRPAELQFGTSGLRGLVLDITDLEAYTNTRGFLAYLEDAGDACPGTTVALAGDLRPSTEAILGAVAQAVRDAGMHPIDCGRIPTPALALYGLERAVPAVMVTGSHIPFDRNGVKFHTPRGEVLKAEEGPILAAVARVRARVYGEDPKRSAFDDDGRFRQVPLRPPTTDEARQAYVRRYLDAFPPETLAGLRVALYEHSAVGRDVLAEILRGLGAEVLPVGRSEQFVAIDTEAISEARLAELQALAEQARAHGPLDAILSTDGDSDRPLLCGFDERGRVRFFGGDLLGAVVADALGADAIAVAMSANDAIDRHFAPRGIPVVRTRIGSPWVIAALGDLKGERRVGWEANGGFLTGSAFSVGGRPLAPLPTRDAVLPLVAALFAARRAEKPLTEVFAALPARFGRADMLDHVPVEDSRALMDAFAPQARRLDFLAKEAEEADGARRPLTADDRALRDRIFRIFTAERGFGPLEWIDRLDGLRMGFEGEDVAHVRPSGNAPQLRIYSVANSEARAAAIAAEGVREPDGILRSMLAAAGEERFVRRVLANIEVGRSLLDHGEPAGLVAAVCGSEPARRFWQRRLDRAASDLRAREVVALHEDLPVNQAFGLLLAWHRLRDRRMANEGVLVAFVFGEGTRSTPLTEAECGQKPALSSFARVGGRVPSVAELALTAFSPVEAFLRRSGFSGMVVKWGDEVQVPTLDLSGTNPRLGAADVVRFVSMRPVTADEAANKDWVGVDEEGRIRAFIPRRPLPEMEKLADRGLLLRRGGALVGGVNLGSIAVSAGLLDALLEEFSSEVLDPLADRRRRPDLDPQLFTALVIAAEPDPEARARAWAEALDESGAVRAMEQRLPGVLGRLRRAVERHEAAVGRRVRIEAMDFGDQYWGDIGQHRQMFALYASLAAPSAEGRIVRALAGVPEAADEAGNRIVGEVRLGPGVEVRNSVLIDVVIEDGRVEDSVLIGTRAGRVAATGAFDLLSTAASLDLAARAGTYKVVSAEPVIAGPGERLTTVFLPEGEVLLRVHEDTPLRDRASTYDVPILGNPMSFAEAHERASASDPDETEARREAARADVDRAAGRSPTE